MIAIMPQVQVRDLRMEDIPVCCVLLDTLRSIALWKYLEEASNYPHTAKLLGQTILDPQADQHCMVAVEEEKIVGLCYAGMTRQIFLPDSPILFEFSQYVMPEYRNTMASRSLWKAMVKWGKAQGAVCAMRGTIVQSGPRRATELVHWRKL